MTKREIETLIEKTVEKTVTAMLPQMVANLSNPHQSSSEEWVSTEEAARILHLSPSRLRAIKDQFTFRKHKETRPGRLVFLRSSLIPNYFS